ncbi:MAG: hypothetical protein ACOYL3_07750 [Desulfuromonadaceae bacterium]
MSAESGRKVSAMNVPNVYYVKQTFPRPQVIDIPAATNDALLSLCVDQQIRSGQKIGITVGSRGIQNLLPILRTTVDFIRGLGCEPFLLSAMGSHGGGSENGQQEVLVSLGITEEALGAKVLTCADCRILTHTLSGLPVFIVESAFMMDGILVVNRVKTHTSFKGTVESGLTKMLVVGLGGPKGAQQFHGFIPGKLSRMLVEIGGTILENLPILGGLGIVENAYEETAVVRGIESERLIVREGELLQYSKSLMPSLPVDAIDLLIVQEIGKNISGTGMDTNIIGRTRIHGVPEPEIPSIKRIAVLDLSKESHGNASGLGMADFTTQKLVNMIDRQATYLNCLTSTFVNRAAIPMYFDTEEKLVEAALFSLSAIPPDKLRIVIIRNTLFLMECFVSQALLPELESRPGVIINQEPHHFKFDSNGNLALKFVLLGVNAS